MSVSEAMLLLMSMDAAAAWLIGWISSPLGTAIVAPLVVVFILGLPKIFRNLMSAVLHAPDRLLMGIVHIVDRKMSAKTDGLL
ncbi:hypothetical protein D477_001344 [Arthrobacter crystallopoietes BAB-32]|uniref:Uncharacterized protein n=1 Tax=Arthrobacter crystallopoietes BAB-32 TaxID=1246476 RepID=N1V030_9MICC|nr:hypothetical protein D477_001344 [Arthrobacter crystallopoietes BAB-32]